jgi:ABC-type multidrug transport system fused ATPase/permease subunit
MYLLDPNYIVKHREKELLIIETSSGRSVLFPFILFFLWKVTDNMILLIFGTILIIALTLLRTEWSFDKNKEEVRKSTICWKKNFTEKIESLKSIRGLRVESSTAINEFPNEHKLYLMIDNGKERCIAERRSADNLKPIIRDVENFLDLPVL